MQRRHSLNEGAFDTITEASAYWCGFLMADGNIGVRKNRPTSQPTVTLHISEVDREHLLAFRLFLGSSHAVTTTKPSGRKPGEKPCVVLSVGSRRLVAALAAFGIVPNKTKRITALSLPCRQPPLLAGPD